jgi:hypothetical protein
MWMDGVSGDGEIGWRSIYDEEGKDEAIDGSLVILVESCKLILLRT